MRAIGAVRRSQGLLLLSVMAVAYGSLYPFRLVAPEEISPRLASLFTGLSLGRSVADALANIALFFPIGLLGPSAIGGDDALSRRRLASICVLGGLLGLALQLGQVLVRGRIPALDDVVWNVVGTVFGAVAAQALPARIRGLPAGSRPTPLPALLAASWLTYLLLPFVPTLDVQALKDSLKPLLLHPAIAPIDILRSATGWLVFSRVWASAGATFVTRAPWFAVVPITLAGQVLVIDNAVTLPGVLGALVAFAAWSALRASPRRDAAIAALLGAAIVLLEIEPFRFGREAGTFHWVPFHGFLEGSLLVALQQLALKTYLYGSAVWLLGRLGWRPAGSSVLLAALLLLLELVQTRLPGRTPEITDALLVLAAGALIAVVEEPREAEQDDVESHSWNR